MMQSKALQCLMGATLLVVSSAGAFAQTRQTRLILQDWKALPGETLYIDSRSPLTANDLRNGEGEPAKIEAHLWLPDNATGAVPVVVLFNCGNTMVKEKEGRMPMRSTIKAMR